MRNAEVIRQWQILKEVESRRTGVTIHELAKLEKVTTRTIRRDLQALKESGFALYDEGGEQETKRWRLETQPFKSVQEGLTVSENFFPAAVQRTVTRFCAEELHIPAVQVEINHRFRAPNRNGADYARLFRAVREIVTRVPAVL